MSPDRRIKATPSKSLSPVPKVKAEDTGSYPSLKFASPCSTGSVADAQWYYAATVYGSYCMPAPQYTYLPASPLDVYFCNKLGIPAYYNIVLDHVDYLQAKGVITNRVPLVLLLGLAIKSSKKGRLSVEDLCDKMTRYFERWGDRRNQRLKMTSIRTILSTNMMFYTVPKPAGMRGRGECWALDLSRGDGWKEYQPRSTIESVAQSKATEQTMTMKEGARSTDKSAAVIPVASVSRPEQCPSKTVGDLYDSARLEYGDEETEVNSGQEHFDPYLPLGLEVGFGRDSSGAHEGQGDELLGVISGSIWY
ncbi:hypothetical protein CONPUDRAFT_167290 [Coniophora puteana RWD-64-598 SS2]|uniref:Fork-head domain-containing protein n=1 Tax=Coniophora puteana (strain RWD-64-598) TaxID=741705 RepID=A0A5M3MGP8_CONPW|nr:uncharacterized protein CONPUDRAFT_167290 [Coniophora puteana RWD-64-598 SS2]EIW78237.1 hypothetical protein CONPUDRAFT_167290 [Coniophora puteana RWD-64-598 SS2]